MGSTVVINYTNQPLLAVCWLRIGTQATCNQQVMLSTSQRLLCPLRSLPGPVHRLGCASGALTERRSCWRQPRRRSCRAASVVHAEVCRRPSLLQQTFSFSKWHKAHRRDFACSTQVQQDQHSPRSTIQQQRVVFRTAHQVSYGEVIKVVGQGPQLGKWEVSSAPGEHAPAIM